MKRLKRALVLFLALGWVPTLLVVAAPWFTDGSVRAQARTPIQVTRIYTGDDGETHMEEYQVQLPHRRGATELSEPIDVTGLQFRRTSPEYFIDWHPAPRRQYVITLSGESEVEIGDGTKIRLHPGHILLAEDTTGRGHISRAVGDKDRISLFIPLKEQ